MALYLSNKIQVSTSAKRLGVAKRTLYRYLDRSKATDSPKETARGGSAGALRTTEKRRNGTGEAATPSAANAKRRRPGGSPPLERA